MSQHTTIVAGVDIAKDALDLAVLPGGDCHRLRNDSRGIARLIALVREAGVERVVFEATGPFHGPLAEALAVAGIAFTVVNPGRARRFAEATGTLAKTDRIDALGLARMGTALTLAPTLLPSPARQRLKDLVAARRSLAADHTANANRLATERDRLCQRFTRARLKQLTRQIAGLEREIAAIVKADEALRQDAARLTTIPGIGPLTAATLLAEMPELGTMTGREAAMLAGLAPIANDSGRRKGPRTIRGGRAALRQALFMPALVAARHNPVLRATYERLRQANKPAKLALVAVMRKLVTIANAMLRDGKDWAANSA